QSSPEMVGRAEEIQRLGQALERAAEGHGGAVVVAGEAGVGKTRLLTEVVASRCAAATGLVGGCLHRAGGAPPCWAVVAPLRSRPFLFLATYRSDALVLGHALHGWLAELVRSAGAELLDLRRLTRPEVADQLDGILGAPARPEVLEAIWERSEGNAFFTEEL